jgi:hypothetical protein
VEQTPVKLRKPTGLYEWFGDMATIEAALTAIFGQVAEKPVRVQWVDATFACSLLAGDWNSNVFRGR